MARPLRIEQVGGWYHITARGNERRAIYRDDRDRERFCELLAGLPARFGLVLHAYVLMDNHYHLMLELKELRLSRAIQWLNVSYSVWFNIRHGRSGHLFQGRFKSVLVDAGEWGLELSRYLHLNPVRIGRLGLGKTDRQRLRQAGSEKPDAQQVRDRLGLLGRYPWSPELATVIACVEKERGEKWDRFRERHGDRGRDLVLYLGRRVCGLKLDELARSVGLKEYASVAMAVKRYAQHLEKNAGERKRANRVARMLNIKI